MSSAAVINATATTGRTAGSPITIQTDGTVTLRAYGVGSGAWSATLAFAPVVGGVTGAPITLTISNVSPTSNSSSTLSDATQWVGWITGSSGEFEASGIVEGITGADALGGFLGDFEAGAAPTKAVRGNATATIAGVPSIYTPGVGWVAQGVPGYINVIQNVTANLATPAVVFNQYLDDDGVIKPFSGYNVTDYIAVVPGKRYTFAFADYSSGKRGCLYDASKNYVSSIMSVLSNQNGDETLVIPNGVYFARFTTLNSNNSTWWGDNYLYEIPARLSVSKSFRSICAMGTSLTNGNAASFYAWWQSVADEFGATKTNLGIGGSTVATSANAPMAGRLNTMVASDVMVLEGPLNDFQTIPSDLGTVSDTSNATFYGALNNIAKYMRGRFPLSLIVWCSDPKVAGWATPNAKGNTLKTYSDAMEYVARSNGFVYVDFFSKFQIGGSPMLYTGDGVHPNAIMRDMMALEFKRVLGLA